MTTSVVFLGTSAAIPTLRRGLPGIAVRRGRTILLFDAGEGVQRAMMVSGLSPVRVEAVFITHLHGDHFFGLPGLIQSMAMLGRSSPLHVYGPVGLSEFLEASFKASRFNPGFDVVVREGEKLVHIGDDFRVESFPTCHSPGSVGFVYKEKDKPGRLDVEKAISLGLAPGPLYALLKRGVPVRVGSRIIRPEEVVGPPRRGLSIAYTGDTLPCSSVRRSVKGVHVLIHDATFTHDLAGEAHERGHSTAREAAETALEAGVQLLILTHISARYRDSSELYLEASRVFPFTLVAEDYMVLSFRT